MVTPTGAGGAATLDYQALPQFHYNCCKCCHALLSQSLAILHAMANMLLLPPHAAYIAQVLPYADGANACTAATAVHVLPCTSIAGVSCHACIAAVLLQVLHVHAIVTSSLAMAIDGFCYCRYYHC